MGRDDLVHNLVTRLSQCDRPIQERVVRHFLLVEDDLGLRVGEGLGTKPADVAHLEPPAGQDLTEEDRKRLENLGGTGPGTWRGSGCPTACRTNASGSPERFRSHPPRTAWPARWAWPARARRRAGSGL